ncbi:protein mono-ADP-ribosyltransferase PARP12 [Gouania willdenowi]|uniref:Protein mono-ADP-ribosyltransferase PARP12-like n=1 Tax=Gouania willdenowi TaxID=441366 RepID=A0A8C5G6C5_GOUWI|nr:protein mono-ADP-ribosyltransferase PARP12-like [Gouania willdenowi]
MEDEIFKIICSNNGAVTTADLLLNLYPGESANVTEVIRNQEKFLLSSQSGEPKVLARSRLRLCRLKECPQTCGMLHLCKNYLLNGSCQFAQQRRVCRFPHDLNSAYNASLLSNNGVENLNRAELCTLLLMNDDFLLPSICYDYNNGPGEFGKCEAGNACKRLHVCERHLRQSCSCPKNHDFNAPQALKVLWEKGVPDTLFLTLKSAYANKEALRSAGKCSAGRGRRGTTQPNQGRSGRDGASWKMSEEFRGRGRGVYLGNRGRGRGGNRGRRGSQPHLSPAGSVGDFFADAAFSNLSVIGQPNESNLNQDLIKTWDQPNPLDKSSTASRGKDSNLGISETDQLQQKTSNSNDNLDGESGQKRPQRQRPVRDKTEICMFFIKGNCIHEERCFKAHDKMPYRWEVKEGNQWVAMPDNESIEKDYCDPQNSYSSSSPPVHFDTMTCGSNNVRRLSTLNSVAEPTFIHTTEWLWYWQDEVGNWNLYSTDINGHNPADISSAALEQKFLDDEKDVEFSAGSQSYTLSLKDMVQTNKRYGTIRVVSRRPRFVSAEDVKKRRKPRPNVSSVPDHWDKSKITDAGFIRIPLQCTSAEFKEVEALFSKTMTGFDVQIERIQNKALWEKYQLQKNQMKTSNGGRNVTEKQLFHGTDSSHVDTICRENLDWRICGTHGTAYGKGSYFARDATYSHNYTGGTGVNTMFLSRVLVGTYCRGSSEYKRPPPKKCGDGTFYDSCVNDHNDPSIFVVFKEQQIYPEYLLKYKKLHPLVEMYGAVPAQKPAVAPTPINISQSTPAPTPAVAPRPTLRLQPTASPRPAIPSSYHTVPSQQPSTPYYNSSTTRIEPVQPSTPSTKSDSCLIM